jgi:kinesin family protein C1
MAHHLEEDDDDEPRKGKGKGMVPLPSHPSSIQFKQGHSTIQIKKSRDPKSTHSLRSLRSEGNMREVSLSTGMSMLTIGDDRLSDQSKALSPRHSNVTSQRDLGTDSTENALVLYEATGDSLVAPKTPSHIPVLSKMEAVVAPAATPCKTPKTPRTSPTKVPFLSKTSNIPAFTAFDIEGRLGTIEAMYSEMKDKMSGASAERNGLDEAVALYKARVAELELLRAQLSAQNDTLQTELNAARQRSDVLQDKLVTATTEFGK